MNCSITKSVTAAVLAATAMSVIAQEGIDDPTRARNLWRHSRGKRVAFVPLGMGFDLTEAWAAGMKRQADELGYKFRRAGPELVDGCRRASGHPVDHGEAGRVWCCCTTRTSKPRCAPDPTSASRRHSSAADQPQILRSVRGFRGSRLGRPGRKGGQSGCSKVQPKEWWLRKDIHQPVDHHSGVQHLPDERRAERTQPQPGHQGLFPHRVGDTQAAKARAVTGTVLQQNSDLVRDHWILGRPGRRQPLQRSRQPVCKERFRSSRPVGGRRRGRCAKVTDGEYYAYVSYNAAAFSRAIVNTMIKFLLQANPKPGTY